MNSNHLTTIVPRRLLRLQASTQTRYPHLLYSLNSLCARCPNKWFALFGNHVASKFFEGEESPFTEVLVKATLYDDFLKERLKRDLYYLRENHEVAHFRVYVDKKAPVNSQDANSSLNTTAEVEPDYFKVEVQDHHETLHYVFRRVSDLFTRDELAHQQLWVQSSIFYCPDCQTYHGLNKKGVLSKGQSLPSDLYTLQDFIQVSAWNWSDVLNTLDVKMACNYNMLCQELVNQIRKNCFRIWKASIASANVFRSIVSKWIKFYFSRSIETFFNVGKDIINLNLGFSITEGDADQDVIVDAEQIDDKLELLERLRDLMENNQVLDTYFYRVAGFIFCLVGKDPRFYSSNEAADFHKNVSYFCPESEHKLDNWLEEGTCPRLTLILGHLFEPGFLPHELTFNVLSVQTNSDLHESHDNSIISYAEESSLENSLDHSMMTVAFSNVGSANIFPG